MIIKIEIFHHILSPFHVCDLVLFSFREILQEKALEVMLCLSLVLVWAELAEKMRNYLEI